MENSETRRSSILLDSFLHDVRYGLRLLFKNPGFTVVAVLTLALGIGANTAIFSLIYGVLVRPLPYRDGQQLVVVHQQARLMQIDDLQFSAKEFFDYRDQNRTMDAVVEHHSMYFVLYGGSEPQRVQTGVVSSNFFDVLGVKPILGRTFVPSDEKPGADAVLVLSDKYWRERQQADPNIVGKVFQMNSKPHTVIGVLPPIPQYPTESDVYMPTNQCPFRSSAAFIDDRNSRLMDVFGRLKPGVKLEQAQADLSTLASNLEHTYPQSYPKQVGYGAKVGSLSEELTRQARPTFLLLLAMAGLVLLIACSNVANLCMARLMTRNREVAVRTALGASRGRLIRQLLTESTILAVIGGGLGILIAEAGLPLLVRFAARFTNRADEIKIDLFVLLFTMLISIGTGLLFGLMPALSTGDKPGAGLVGALKEGSGRGSSAGKNRARAALVVAQVAVSFVLLIGAGLMVRSLIELQRVNPGFNPDKVLVLRLAPNFTKVTTSAQYAGLWERIMEKVKPLPGVQVAALASTYPLNPAGILRGPNAVGFQIEGQPVEPGKLEPQVDAIAVTPDYFRATGTPLVSGRYFTDLDNQTAPGVAIINESTAHRRWNKQDPIGRRVSFNGGKSFITIVGVVGDVKQYGLDRPSADEIYSPIAQVPNAGYLLVRTVSDPMSVANQVRSAIHQVDSETAVDQVQTLREVRDNSVASPRLTAVLLSLFAVLALIITATGIAGVIALSVTQRTREIGIRMALGASQTKVLGMVMQQGVTLVLIGLGIGLVSSVILARLMQSLLFGTTTTDPITYAAVSIVLLVVAALACFLPARRVTHIDPMIALRAE